MNTVKLFLRSNQINIDGSQTVYLRLTINRKSKYFSLDVKVKKEDWNELKSLVKRSDFDFNRKNKLIKKQYDKALSIVDYHFLNDIPLNFSIFKNQFRANMHENTLLKDFVLEVSKESEGILSEGTLDGYKKQLSKLEQFRQNIYLSDIDLQFLNNYQKYMIEDRKNNKNTQIKGLSFLKQIINKAIKKGILKVNPFKDLPLPNIKGQRAYLNADEIRILENLYHSERLRKNKKNVLSQFLFCCFTGLRYSDLKTLNKTHIKEINIGGKIEKFIYLDMHKTGKPVQIPIIKRALHLLPEAILPTKPFFKVLTNQPTNRYLKEIMKVAGIDKNITFHCARHTFATSGLSYKIPVTVIKDILGHTDIATTLIYAKVSNELKFEELMKLETN